MGQNSNYVDTSRIAAGKGTTVGGALSLVGGFQLGCVIARTGVGVITITLDVAVGFAVAAQYLLWFQTNTAGGLVGIAVDTSDQVKTVTMQTVAGAATESAFWFEVERILTRPS